MYLRLKHRCFEILEVGKPGDTASRQFDIVMLLLIITNVIAVVLETVEGIFLPYKAAFQLFETISVMAFTVEYLLRLWSCTSSPEFEGTLKGRLKFIFSPMALIDLAAILPFYLPMVMPVDLRILRALRLVRLLRLLKMTRYTKALNLVGRVLLNAKEELAVTAGVVFLLLLISSSLMYYVEHDAQPEEFSSIPAAMWWGIATLTTVGYGDVYPITIPGKLLGAVISFLGIGLFALPAGILGSGFLEEVQRKRRPLTAAVCPHCGGHVPQRRGS